MNLFQAIQSRTKTHAINSDHLPEVNSFVDVATGGKTEHLPIEAIGRDLQVRCPAKAVVGTSALFNYSNRMGRFRFHANCTSIDGKIATFALPITITVIEEFGNKRRNVRLKAALPVKWRYAPDGKGYGDLIPGNTTDISCVGIGLIVPRELKPGTQVEVKFDFDGKPLVLIGTLARPTQKQPGGKFLAGMAFEGIRPTDENRIAEYISSRHQGQRKRALAD